MEHESFATRIAKQKALVYDLRVRGFFFILKVSPGLHDNFRKALNGTENFSLKDYGEILFSGRGEPPEKIKEHLHTTFGMYENPNA